MADSKKIAWLSWAIASLFYSYQYILRVMPNVMMTDIMSKFNIDSAIFGQFSGAYYLGYCIMHLPLGILIDKYGPRKILSYCIVVIIIGILPIIFTKNWLFPILGRFLIGAGSSAAILGTFKLIRVSFDEKKFTKMLSLSVTIGLIGAIYGVTPIAILCKKYNYVFVIKILIIIGLILFLLTYLLIPNIITTHNSSIKENLKSIITNKKVLCICTLAGFMIGPMEGFADAWGAEFLKNVYSIDATSANYTVSLIYVGMCFAPLLSKIAEISEKYLETIVGAGVIMLTIFFMLICNILKPDFLPCSFFIVGICSAYQILAIYIASTYVTKENLGLTAAIANMIIMSFGYIFHSIIGLLVKYFSYLGMPSACRYGISFIPIMLFIGTIGFLIITISDSRVSNCG